MTGNRVLWYTAYLLLLPVAVAAFGLPVFAALALVVIGLLWRWGITLSGILAPARVPRLELETISASHFVEKVRWCMDRLGVDYRERPSAGTLGGFFLGRSVPQLKIRTGIVRSVIGNSPDILRYLWGRYAVEQGERAAFLEPTAERLALEKRIDRVGVDLQVWVYYHLFNDRGLTLHAWGVHNPLIPLWQRVAVRLLYPLQSALIRTSFRITEARKAKAIEHIDAQLGEVEALLADGRVALLGGATPDYVDFAFAAIHGLWLQPKGFGAGNCETTRIERELAPVAMREEIESWIRRFPRATAHIEALYANERVVGDSPAAGEATAAA